MRAASSISLNLSEGSAKPTTSPPIAGPEADHSLLFAAGRLTLTFRPRFDMKGTIKSSRCKTLHAVLARGSREREPPVRAPSA